MTLDEELERVVKIMAEAARMEGKELTEADKARIRRAYLSSQIKFLKHILGKKD